MRTKHLVHSQEIKVLQIMGLMSLATSASVVRKKRSPGLFRPEILLPIVGFAGVILIWWIVSLFRQEMMPSPIEALTKNFDLIIHPFYHRGPGDMGIGWLLLASLRRVCIGFLLGAVVAIPVGFWIGLSRPAWLAINPIIQVFKPVSPLVWLPIALAIFNAAEPSAIFVIFITSLWSTIMNTAEGVSNVPKDYLEVAQVLEMPRWKQLVKIVLPACLPYIFTGLRISMGIAWLVIVAVEMLTGGVGIGFFVWDEWNRLNVSSVFLAVFVIGLTGLVLDYALARLQSVMTGRPVN
jgi:nitrate/nitrite transport system permease protein